MDKGQKHKHSGAIRHKHPISRPKRMLVVKVAETLFTGKDSGIISETAWHVPQTKQLSDKLLRQRINPSAYVALLEQCLEKLQILGLMVKANQKFLDIPDDSTEHTTDSNSAQTHILHYNTLDPIATLNVSSLNFLKYNSDRFFIEKLIATAIKDLSETKSIYNFTKLLRGYFDDKKYHQQLLQNKKENDVKLKELSRSIDDGKVKWNKEIEEKTGELGRIKDLYEDTLYVNEVKARYVNHWEEARQYQHYLKLSLQQKEVESNVNLLEENYSTENFVHDQIKSYISIKESEYLKEIEEWAEKYDKDMTEIIWQINKVSGNLDRLREQFRNVYKQYNLNQNEIQAYLEEKEQRQKEYELYLLKSNAATKIQAWWRGMMVRHCLGAYRKKKSRKGGKANIGEKKGIRKKKT